MSTLRPAAVCRQLLATLDASEGRRRQRKRNTTPDAIGLTMKRDVLAGAVQDDPEPMAFESWLLRRCQTAGMADGPVRAMALEILTEWRLAEASQPFRQWLAEGAPSDDAS
jgi:hypothetical protein